MLKILVVDDERIIRKGLIKTIGAINKDYHVIGEAVNGIEALELIEKEAPDVVITDIKMPDMDGIELIEHLKKRFPSIKKIVLSGYDEFKYVREALKKGTSDYLLKPVDFKQLIELLEKIENDIKDEQETNQNELDLKIKFNQSFPLLREQIMRSFICEGKFSSAEKIEEKLQYFNIGLSFGRHQVVIVSLDNYRYYCEEDGIEATNSNLLIIRKILERTVPIEIEYFSFAHDIGLVIVFSIPNSKEGIINRISKEIFNNIQDNAALNYTISVGKPADSFERLKESFDSALNTLMRRFYLTGSKVIRFDEEHKCFNKNYLLSLTDTYQIRIKSCVDIVDEKQIPEVLDEFCLKLKEMPVKPSDAVRAFVDIFSTVQVENENFREAVIETYGFDYSYEKSINLFDTLHEIKMYTCHIYKEIISSLKVRYNKKDTRLVELVKDYILKHYMEDISLSKVADVVYITPNYLSEVFKAQTRESFVDYFTRVRIEKAKELIKETASKAYMVGELVGYDDSAYFSKVFKKVVGVSPTEYKNLVR